MDNVGKPVKLVRPYENPIITPIRSHHWKAKATFNPAAICLDGYFPRNTQTNL